MKRGDYRDRMVVPKRGMLFLPAMEERLDWNEFTWEARTRHYLAEYEENERYAAEMARLHEEFWA